MTWLVFPLVFCCMAAATRVQAANPIPAKLGVTTSSPALVSGEKLVIEVTLLSAGNEAVRAPHEFQAALQTRSQSGQVAPLGSVSIAAGSASARRTVTIGQTGLLYVWAKNAELLPGGAYVDVQARSVSTTVAAPQPVAPAGPPREVQAPPAEGPAPPPPRRTLSARPQLVLRFSPDREFLANGKDQATIQAFLTGPSDSLPSDLLLTLYDSSHTLLPNPLRIPAGLPTGQAALSSTQPGPVTVEFIAASPSADVEGDKKLKISFMPPISQVSVRSSPPRISLVDVADLIVTLSDEEGRPVATPRARQVTLALAGGPGHIDKEQLQIAAGEFEARTRFVPEWAGNVSIVASTPNLLNATTSVGVDVPLVLLVCSAAGGAVGGLLARRTRRKSDRYRPYIGIATGLLLYWACIFIGLATVIGRAYILNPLSAVCLSAVGGWLQTEVFTAVWQTLRPGAKAKKT